MAVTSTTKQVCSVAEEFLNSFMNRERERESIRSPSRKLFMYSSYT